MNDKCVLGKSFGQLDTTQPIGILGASCVRVSTLVCTVVLVRQPNPLIHLVSFRLSFHFILSVCPRKLLLVERCAAFASYNKQKGLQVVIFRSMQVPCAILPGVPRTSKPLKILPERAKLTTL